MDGRDLQARGAILVGAMLWGTAGTAQALAPAGADPVVVGGVRLIFGSLPLMAICLTYGRFAVIKSLRVRSILAAAVRDCRLSTVFFRRGTIGRRSARYANRHR